MFRLPKIEGGILMRMGIANAYHGACEELHETCLKDFLRTRPTT